MIKRLRSLNDTIAGKEIAKPIYNLLNLIIERDGEIVKNNATCPAFRSQLRLIASSSILKLSKYPLFDSNLSVNNRCNLGLIIQDPNWQIRVSFVERLCKYLQLREIPFKFLALLFIAAHEPMEDLKFKIKSFISRLTKQQQNNDGDIKSATVESTFVILLHAISHHPEFSTDEQGIDNSAQFIDFFLTTVASPENISYLFYAASQLKTLCDLHAEKSAPLYLCSDLAQFMIQEYCSKNGWTLTTYPSSVDYDRELFKRLKSADGAENLKKNFLPLAWSNKRKEGVSKVNKSRRKSNIDASAMLYSDDEFGDQAEISKFTKKTSPSLSKKSITESPTPSKYISHVARRYYSLID